MGSTTINSQPQPNMGNNNQKNFGPPSIIPTTSTFPNTPPTNSIN